MPNILEQKARAAAAALTELRQAAMAEAAGRPATAGDAVMELAWRSNMAPQELAEAALAAAVAGVSADTGFQPGAVFCYHCKSSGCPHATAREAGHVFSGYSSLGLPEWEEFFNVLLALEDPRTDTLFGERPELLARVVGRPRLVQQQLVTFGKHSLSYRIWGQVVAGYFRTSERRDALTVQIVETRDRRLHLQLLASAQLRELLADTPDDQRSSFFRAYDAIQDARRQLEALLPAWQPGLPPGRNAEDQLREEAFGILRHLARSLERKGRQEHRRTVHAETRGQQARPVHMATDDLAAATPDSFFRDAFRQSIVVRGPSGRCHVFNDGGRHITTLAIAGDEFDIRVRRQRYVPLDAAALALFRQAWQRAGNRGTAASTV